MSLSSKEWQLLLVLQELEYELSRTEKNMKVKEWLKKTIERLQKRSGW